MQRFNVQQAMDMVRKNGKHFLPQTPEPCEEVVLGMIGLISGQSKGGHRRAHIYLDPFDAPGSNIYFDPADEQSLDKIRLLDSSRRWIVKGLIDAGYKVIVSREMACQKCTGLPSNPCDECNGKQPKGISFKKEKWLTHSFIEVRW